ncbi:MAG TPA: protein kinase [Ktedonobacteraceae bacterium]
MDKSGMLGKEIGNYRIIAEINSGAFGSVYKAEHIHLKERVAAIKLLHTYLGSQQEQEQFAQEAQILEMLKHPYILPLYDFGFSERQPYLIAQYATGGSLRDRLRQQKLLRIEQIIAILVQVGQALYHAHQRNIIHRDLKPENILFNAQGEALLADFGIATMLSTASIKHVTTILGTPAYMAPEQFQSTISKESDQYALGCIAYELMTGYLPFRASDALSMGYKHVNEQPLPPTRHNPQIPATVEAAILKAMAKQRAERYPDILTFLTALREPFTRATMVHIAPQPAPIQPTIPASPAPLAPPVPKPLAPTPGTRKSDLRSGFPEASPSVSKPVISRPQHAEVAEAPPVKPGILRRLSNLVFEPRTREQQVSASGNSPGNPVSKDDGRLLYTALDIGTACARAIIVEVQDDIAVVLGVGRQQQNYSHMSDGIVTDIPGVIANCNEALLRAEEAAGGVIAPKAIIGIAGELVKGSSNTITKQRQQPQKPITPEELASVISSVQQKLLKAAKERIAAETGYPNIEVRLINAAIISVSIDGQILTNPIGFRGRHFTLTLFSAFAPLAQLGALQTVAQGLDLTLTTLVDAPYALAHCLSHNASANSGAIFIDIGGNTTDIALVRQGGIEETGMFALGGHAFNHRLATHKGLSLKEAEKLKISYSQGLSKGTMRDEIQQVFAAEAQTWMDSVELLFEQLSRGELLPPAIYLVGGGSSLPNLSEKLKSFPWTERLPFSHAPIIQTIQPGMISSIADPKHLLKDERDITLMALAYQAIKLQDEDSILERTLYQVIHSLHI